MLFFFSSRRRHTRSLCDWSSDVCSSDLDRWQTAGEVGAQLEAMSTPSGGMPPTGATATISSGTEDAIRRGHPVRVAALRSEERRVGKEWRSRWSRYHCKKKSAKKGHAGA